MLAVRRLLPDDWPLYRELRLAALADAPDAFCSTLADAVARPDADWHERLERADPDTSEPLVATLDGVPCGLLWAMADRARPGAAELFQMWVAPAARGHGVGRRLVGRAAEWAATRGHAVLALECRRDNPSAVRLYERSGFVTVGAPRPLREGSDIAAVAMERRLGDAGAGVASAGGADPGIDPGIDPGPELDPGADREHDELAATLAFLDEAGKLKDVLRSGYTNAGSPESTAEHTWRLCLWIVALGERVEGFDVRRLLELAVVHDLGEALNGDTPAPLQGLDPDREARERRDLNALTDALPASARTRVRRLWEEYEAAVTPEGRLIRGLDKLETMLQHAGGTNPANFDYAFNLDYGRERTDAEPLTRALRTLVDEATRRRMVSADERVGEADR